MQIIKDGGNMKEIEIGHSKVQIIVGDITKQDTNAVVNAANKQLAPGGGVAGAIHGAAGPGLWEECSKLGGCETGQAKISSAYDLPNKYVIHTVGPIYSGSEDDPRLLRSCYINCLKLADENNISSISFPALSTGIFGYPIDAAAQGALKAIMDYLLRDTKIDVVRMVLYDQAAYNAHLMALDAINAGVDLT
ncbi:MAG: macro domain-containing protein [Thermodesulfobacteriota bacterium]|nr:macro domain-containing protein [Thermodesulfobacteriota bacterium]